MLRHGSVVGAGEGRTEDLHARVDTLLPSYAAGILSGRTEAVVRRHLLSCRPCLEQVWDRPVGVPRAAPALRTAGSGVRGMGVVAGVVIVAVGTVIGSKSIHRRSPSARPAIVTGTDVRSLTERADRASARLAEVGRAMGDLRQRLGRLASETIDTRRKASLLASRVEPLERAVARNERAARAFGTFAATLADTGARIVPLMPGAAAGPAMGWVAWDPLRRRLFVYAVGLPGLRVPWFVESADGAVRLPLERLDDGGAWATIEPMVPATCAFAVRIVPPDADRIVLRGSVAVCPGLPPA